jgi:hypothetical protein
VAEVAWFTDWLVVLEVRTTGAVLLLSFTNFLGLLILLLMMGKKSNLVFLLFLFLCLCRPPPLLSTYESVDYM